MTDIVVSLDTTGSMFPCVTEARRRISELTSQLFDNVPDLRMALIAHGDYQDSPYETKVMPFTKDRKVLKRFIETVQRTSGFGNGGECYEKVFNEVSKLDWQSDKRVYVMVGDEPAHPGKKRIWTRRRSNYMIVPFDWKEEQANLLKNGITTYPVRCLNRNDSRAFHNSLAQMNEVPLLHLHQFANLIELLIAVAFKQESDDLLQKYGEGLEKKLKLNRNLAQIINLLLNKENLVGGIDYKYPSNTDLKEVDPTRFQILNVDNKCSIKDFVQASGATFKVGKGFYELSKRETIQERKEVILRNQKGDLFTGAKAREMIGLPYGQRGKISPPRNLDYDVFVQSTSWNRKLMPNTEFLYEVDVQ